MTNQSTTASTNQLIEEALKEFETEFLHGMKIHVSKPYSQMALEREFFNKQIKFLEAKLRLIATKSSERERTRMFRELIKLEEKFPEFINAVQEALSQPKDQS